MVHCLSPRTGFNVKEMHPYSVFMTTPKLGGGGWIRKLKPNKDLVVQELKRRDPYARPNKNNRAADEMMQLFTPLTDPRDVAFVTMKELEFRQKMINMLKECEDAKKEVRRCSLSTPSKRPRVDYSNAYAGSVEGGGMYIQPNGSLSMHAAKAVLEAAEEYAARCKWKVSIAIVDAVGNPMYVKRMEDAFPGSFEMAIGKAKRAVHFKQLNGSGAGDAKGSLAIIIDDVCCAGIGVAGESAKPDAIAAEGINALRNLAEMQEPGEARDV